MNIFLVVEHAYGQCDPSRNHGAFTSASAAEAFARELCSDPDDCRDWVLDGEGEDFFAECAAGATVWIEEVEVTE